MKRLLLIVLVAGLAACEDEPIRSYMVPKPQVIDPSGGRDFSVDSQDQPDAQPQNETPSPPARLVFEVPQHWQQVDDPSGMRAVSLQAGEGDEAVTITGMSLPAARFEMAANVRRWAGPGQAELVNPTQEQLAQAVSPFESDHAGAQFAVLEGPAKAILAVAIPRNTDIWFFKMIGPTPRVQAERTAFEAFVRSVEFKQDATP